VSGGRALAEVLGLVVRRQAGLWADWQPWVSVLAIALPIGLMLSHAARWWADAYAIRGVYLSREVLGPDNAVGTADDLRPLWPISLVMVWPAVAILFSTWRRASASSSRSSASVPSPSMRKPNGIDPTAR
jgi:hypothetical protein